MPTLKQKKAFKEVGVNGGILSKAMKAAGYSESVAKRTDKLVNTKGWSELMEQHLPDKLLAQRHKELLNKREKTIIERTQGESPIYEVLDQPDTQAVSKGLELAYKIKGKIQNDDTKPLTNPVININFFASPEIKDLTKKLDDAVITAIRNETKEPDTTLPDK